MKHQFRVIGYKDRGKWVIEGSEALYVKNVIKKKVGDFIEVVDGCGHFAAGPISKVKKDLIEVEQEQKSFCEKPDIQRIVCVGALDPKTYPIEEISELGVDELWIYPSTQTDKRRISDEVFQKLCTKSLLSIKQSKRLWPLVIRMFSNLGEVLKEPSYSFYVMSPDAQSESKAFLIPCVFIVGAEAGFDGKELEQLSELPSVKISPHILRAKTAMIAAAAHMQACSIQA